MIPIALPNRARAQNALPPSANAQIDWSNPITDGLVWACHANIGFQDRVRKKLSYINAMTDMTVTQNKYGKASKAAASGGYIALNTQTWSPNPASTIVMGGATNAASGRFFQHNYFFLDPYGTNQLQYVRFDSSWTYSQIVRTTTSAFQAGVPFVGAFRTGEWPGTTNMAAWINGKDVSGTHVAAGGGSFPSPLNIWFCNQQNTPAMMLDGELNFFLYWDRALSDDEMRSITLNPHQVWRNGGRTLYLPEPWFAETINPPLAAGTVRLRLRPDTNMGRAQLKVVLVDDAGVSQGESSWLEVDTVTKTLTADITATGAATGFKLLKQGYGGDWIPFFW